MGTLPSTALQYLLVKLSYHRAVHRFISIIWIQLFVKPFCRVCSTQLHMALTLQYAGQYMKEWICKCWFHLYILILFWLPEFVRASVLLSTIGCLFPSSALTYFLSFSWCLVKTALLPLGCCMLLLKKYFYLCMALWLVSFFQVARTAEKMVSKKFEVKRSATGKWISVLKNSGPAIAITWFS